MADNVNKELFLDILTKEEKEALLTKKMEEIRKKNEALRKRHEEIEADKRVAATNNPNKDVNACTRESNSGPSSPRKESKSLPGEDKPGARPPKSSGRGRTQGGGVGKNKDKKPQGPPPDPSYNFLSDRRREGPTGGREGNTATHAGGDQQGGQVGYRGESRRHPKNYGGQDFNNVKAQMRTSKERQERPKSGPPRTKMELSVAMTGRERRQYMEWKAERDRVDQERLDRQKSNSGEWRRAWDADKNQQDFEQPQSPHRSEPAKRPAGRIGSGRFDRGEREERLRGEAPRPKAGVWTDQEAQTKPVGRGRARGRGRGRGRGDRSPRQRTISSGDESRKVERQKDLLVVKIDNSGKESNQSVEVEYWDDDLVDVRSTSAASVKSGTSSQEGWDNGPGQSCNARNRKHDDHQFDDHDAGHDHHPDSSQVKDKQTYSQSLGDENEHDESWEDCPEDGEFYADVDEADGDRSQGKEPLRLECKLNPDAPVFTPTSPELMKTPPGHVKVMDWVTEVTDNLSPTSPPLTLEDVKKEDIKKTLFENKQTEDNKQSSSNGGVTSATKAPEEDLGASYIEDNDTGHKTAPVASDEFLDAPEESSDQAEFTGAEQKLEQLPPTSDSCQQSLYVEGCKLELEDTDHRSAQEHQVDNTAGDETTSSDQLPAAEQETNTQASSVESQDSSAVIEDSIIKPSLSNEGESKSLLVEDSSKSTEVALYDAPVEKSSKSTEVTLDDATVESSKSTVVVLDDATVEESSKSTEVTLDDATVEEASKSIEVALDEDSSKSPKFITDAKVSHSSTDVKNLDIEVPSKPQLNQEHSVETEEKSSELVPSPPTPDAADDSAPACSDTTAEDSHVP